MALTHSTVLLLRVRWVLCIFLLLLLLFFFFSSSSILLACLPPGLALEDDVLFTSLLFVHLDENGPRR